MLGYYQNKLHLDYVHGPGAGIRLGSRLAHSGDDIDRYYSIELTSRLKKRQCLGEGEHHPLARHCNQIRDVDSTTCNFPGILAQKKVLRSHE